MVKIEHCDEGDATSAKGLLVGFALKTRSYLLSKMSFSKKEVDLAFSKLGEGASLDQLVNWIMTNQEASNEKFTTRCSPSDWDQGHRCSLGSRNGGERMHPKVLVQSSKIEVPIGILQKEASQPRAD
ncbi:hypothetical protein ZWY2020_001937 [Hordeum vulgare]|nr:hypothetical protein ZWY2020_001937 [Hordeum vulgare]